MQPDEGIVLRTHPYSETSQVVTLLTRGSGRMRLLGRGLQRSTRVRVSVGIDLLERGAFLFRPSKGGDGLGTLLEWRQLDARLSLRTRLSHTIAALYAAETVALLTAENDPDESLFHDCEQLIHDLSASDAAPVVLLAAFEHELLKRVGFAPVLDRCASCDGRVSGARRWFSSRAGGLLCEPCAHTAPERILADPPRADESQESRARRRLRVFDYHIRHVAGRAPRSSEQMSAALRLGTHR